MSTTAVLVEKADEGIIDYGYVVRMADEDWKRVIAVADDPYIAETVEDYLDVPLDERVEWIGIHMDASQVADLFGLLADLDLSEEG